MKNVKHAILSISFLLFACASGAEGQTTIQGKLLSVDGSIIPKTVISVQQDNPRDIFSGYDDDYAGSDGSYELTIDEPGLYNIKFSGIYHQTVSVPFLIIDQPSIEMDVLIFPTYFNDGRYFENDDYLQWIRVVGNFNNYDFLTGRSFSKNKDGSISAFIPLRSDTLRYQVRGLNYGRGGATPLPLADEYHIREDRTFESVLYRNLPYDSLEIRYIPGESIPFQRILPSDAKREWLNANGFISFKNKQDRHWVEPVRFTLGFRTTVPVIERDLAYGLSVEEQTEYLETHFSEETLDHLRDIKQQVLTELSKPDIDQQQRAMLCIGYAVVLNRMEMRRRRLMNTQQTIRELFGEARSEEIENELNQFEEIKMEEEILMKIPELVSPVHPVWNRAQMLPQFLLNITDGHTKFLEYFTEIVKHHPAEFTINRVVSALVREMASAYSSVEEMEVYQLVVERFGEGDMARQAHRVYNHYRDQD